jgi:hypothetical protein
MKSVLPPKKLYFEDLRLNESFRIKNCEAVYVKVQVGNDDDYYSYEIQRGKLWVPTKSEVERVPVKVEIDAEKPELYED